VSMQLRYLVVIEHAEGTGYSTWAPDLPGCIAAADTREECERLMREAIALHLAGIREDGGPIPEPSAIGAAMVEIEAA
jgi:predicted RNase H-like HicB family nuclease